MDENAVLAIKKVSIFGMEISQSSLTVSPLNFASFVYLFACFSYFFALAKAGTKNEKFWNRFSALLIFIAWGAHTFGIFGRWYVGGLDRPPWTNLYESLIGFAWMFATFLVYAIWKWGAPLVGAFASPLIFLLMGMSVMTPNKDVEPLIPALQSYWLKIHVLFGMISYAGFTIAACFGILHLFKNKVSHSKIGIGICTLMLLNLGIAGGYESWTMGKFMMTKTVARQMSDGTVQMVADRVPQYPGSNKMITRLETVPYANAFYFAGVVGFVTSMGLFAKRRKKSKLSAHPEMDLDTTSLGTFVFSVAMVFGICCMIALGMKSSPTLTLASNPYLTQLLAMSFFFAGLYLVICWRFEGVYRALPTAQRLDELGYKNILFAFPFQTLLLVTGAIWAKYAWSRAWGWDPKEVWALITWLVYLIYLHGKLLLNWKPNLLSAIAILGFMVMVFAFLGVNLVLSGLHSYGAA